MDTWFDKLSEAGCCDLADIYAETLAQLQETMRNARSLDRKLIDSTRGSWSDGEIADARENRTIADTIARAIAPDAWAEYDAGEGTCTIGAGLECRESLIAAKRVMDAIGGQ